MYVFRNVKNTKNAMTIIYMDIFGIFEVSEHVQCFSQIWSFILKGKWLLISSIRWKNVYRPTLEYFATH